MRVRPNPVEALANLPKLSDSVERRSSWRQAIAALGQKVRVAGPPPLDGLDVESLLSAMQLALETGLADDLDWIAPGPAAVALYELSAALPPGRERRDLGRRVFARLYEGTASTFAAVATRMALGSGKQLDTPTLRARIELVFDLPIGTSVNADPLALALVSRRALMPRWLLTPSTGALPARRMAAKLVEHAAREAAMRGQQGDSHARDVMNELVRPTLTRLLFDREPLVWRHAAVARGLLATTDPRLYEEIELGLDPSLSPTEWRRSAVSLVASLTGDPRAVSKRLRNVLAGELVELDPGLPATMVFGLPRVIEAEPDAAEELLDRLSATKRSDVAEATAALLGDCMHPNFGARAAAKLRTTVSSQAYEGSAATQALVERSLRLLGRSHLEETSIAAEVRRALVAYETTGARAAYDLATQAVTFGHRTLDRLSSLDALSEERVAELVESLSDLDESVLERSRLASLLLLSRRPGEADFSVPALERLYHAVGNWVIDQEQRATEAPWTPNAEIISQKRLRALLHLVDLETTRGEGDDKVRLRLRRAVQVLLARLTAGPDPAVHRILCATLARSFDAAIRESVAEPADLLVLVMHELTDRATLQALADGSLAPEMSEGLSAYGEFLSRKVRELDPLAELDADTVEAENGEETGAGAAARVVSLSRSLGAGGSYRGEALRQVVFRLGRALEAIAQSRGLSDLVDTTSSGAGPVADLEAAIAAFRQLSVGASQRVLGTTRAAEEPPAAPLSSLVERALRAGLPVPAQELASAISDLSLGLPLAIEEPIAKVVCRLDSLPVAGASDVFSIPSEKRRAALPDWLLPRRTIGAFYVVRALGSGGVSSVFVARRFEERHNAKAEAFALKVPEYDPTTARSLSEQEFLQLFRDEAGALLSLPAHPNLARFVTFDLAARPKPILVMELIRGFGLDRLIRSRALTVRAASRYLLGILSGLEAMHKVGVGHLDIKPSNVILRDSETPVLVDFGLSGRQLRPGCGTLEYCAPEVLGVVPEGLTPSPIAADIYAFACTAFETLTSRSLFEAEDEMTLASQHVSHDGWPVKLVQLSATPGLADLCVVLAACLRHDPRGRPTAAQVRAALSAALRPLVDKTWPLMASPAMDAAS